MSSLSTPPGLQGHLNEKQPVSPSGPMNNGPYLAYQPAGPASGPVGQAPVYSEVDSNPLPQIVFGDALPEVHKITPVIYPDAMRDGFVNSPIPVDLSGQEANMGTVDDNNNNNNSTSSSNNHAPWYQKKSLKALSIIAAVCVVGILAILFGTLGGLNVFSGNNRNAAAASSNHTSTASSVTQTSTASATGSTISSSTTTSSASKTSSSSSTSSSIPLPPQCTDYTDYLHNVSFITPAANVGLHGLGYSLPDAKSQEECCGICYNHTSLGCNLWVWDPVDHKTVPCTIIMGYIGANYDHWCPYGHTNSSNFMLNTNGSGIFSSGPCGDGGTLYDGESWTFGQGD